MANNSETGSRKQGEIVNLINNAATASLDGLASAMKGRVVRPGDDDYDETKSVFYGGSDRRPIAIARVANEEDVTRVISFAREAGLELAVRSGGHSVARHSLVHGGIVLDLRDLKGLEVDVESRTAWAETGLTAGEYTNATAPYGLATGFGDTGSVGIGGITLGGGIGYLVRKHGMTIDDLLAAEVVTADGETLYVDPESHPDLFWAIRGGGGNFGVATRYKLRLHEVDTIVGGMLFLPATSDVIVSLVEETLTAPDELSSIVNVMKAPPVPFIPQEHHGRPVVMAIFAYAGNLDDGERFVDRVRKLAPPIADMVRRMPYAESYPPEEEGFHPLAAFRTMFAETVDRDAVGTILDQLESSNAMMAVAHLRPLGGALARVPVDATAFAHRDRALLVNVAALYVDPASRDEHETWVAQLSDVLGGAPGAYAGFLGEDGPARIHEAYPDPVWDRLVQVKAKYDPENVFRLNHNVPPTD
jgi:FAD/FMN-containing dehydrogenase